MMNRYLLALSLAFVAACVVGSPPGFSSGDNWEVPLVAPLENDSLLVPVSINGEGPFLFMIDPDSEVSSVESSLQAGLKLYAGRSAAQKQNENDNLIRIIIAEIPKMTLGSLSVRNLRVRVHADGAFWSGGRRVRGIIGKDIIADSLIYSFNRDRGVMYIGTQGHLPAPEGAKAISFSQSYGNHRRYLSKFKLNHKHTVSMHLDLGARTTLLWSKLIDKYKFPKIPVSADLVDEFGTTRHVDSGTIVGIVESGGNESNGVLMLPYGDKRLEPEDLDGVIGQNFWSKFNVVVNWHHKKFYMTPRSRDLAAHATERLERWGSQLKDCATPACMTVTMTEVQPQPIVHDASTPSMTAVPSTEFAAPPEGAPPPIAPPGTTPPEAVVDERKVELPATFSLMLERTAPGTDFAYDVLVGAVDDKGKSLDLPPFLASFQSGVPALGIPELAPEYGKAAKFIVLDMSPVGLRGCDGGRCIYQLPTITP